MWNKKMNRNPQKTGGGSSLCPPDAAVTAGVDSDEDGKVTISW
jgi:hypothetical protein